MQDTDLRPHPKRADLADLAELAGWIRVQQTPELGRASVRNLMAEFGSAQLVLGAGYRALRAHLSAAVARALCEPPSDAVRRQVELSLAWLGQSGNHLLTLLDAAYPVALAHIPDPPPLLYVKGRPQLLAAPMLAIVGSRNATVQGKANAEVFAQALSCAGLTIVSGLALGIDAAAHAGALGGPGSTVAVIGTGADTVYPARNHALAHRIAEQGCIVSEFALGTPALSPNFPRRNRIISGLAAGVLVVEAAAQSGSLITAHLAVAQGRDVFAIPGSIHAALAKGCHKLIKEGAKLVESAADVLEELRMSPLVALAWAPTPAAASAASTSASASASAASAAASAGSASAASASDSASSASASGSAGSASTTSASAASATSAAAAGQALLAAMAHEPVDADTLALLCAAAPGQLSLILLELELAGQVERLPGGLFQRINR